MNKRPGFMASPKQEANINKHWCISEPANLT